jgi:acyl carrier protein
MIDYFEEVKKIISRQFGLGEEMIEENPFLETDLNITELDMEDLVAKLEEKYQVKISQNTYSNFKQVSDIAAYLYEQVDQI